MTAYKWKVPGLFGVEADKAGEVLDALYRERGEIKPAALVDVSRPKDAPLHCLFEWNDEAAAEEYRKQQARSIICNVVTVGEVTDETYTRAFVHVESSYQPISIVLDDRDKTAELLACAKREMRSFQRKYHELSELASVIQAMDDVLYVETTLAEVA